MLLAFDIGNTNVVGGCFDKDELKYVFRLKTDPDRTVDEYAGILLTLFEKKLDPGYTFDHCIVSSVVPPLTPDIVRLAEEVLNVKSLVIGPGVKTGLSINTISPEAVGTDRVVNAVAARAMFGTPALIVDFGTATSLDYVSASGGYEGGVIIPGVRISLDSLVEHTAKLPRIELAWPEKVVGKDTVTAMQSGSVIGYMCMIDGLIDRVSEEVGGIEHIIATGGIGKLFYEHSDKIQAYEPNLTLLGLKVLADLNFS